MKWTNSRIIKLIVGLIMLSVFIFLTQSWFTHWPNKAVIEVNERQQELLGDVRPSDLFGDWAPLSYFTNISNILVITTLTFAWVFGIRINKYVKIMVFTYMTITMLIFWTLLAPFVPWDASFRLDFEMSWEHGVVWIVYMIYFFTSRKEEYRYKKTIWLTLIFPLAYFVYGIALYYSRDVAIYPFFNILNPYALGYSEVISVFISIASFICIYSAFMGITAIGIKLNSSKADKKEQTNINKENKNKAG